MLIDKVWKKIDCFVCDLPINDESFYCQGCKKICCSKCINLFSSSANWGTCLTCFKAECQKCYNKITNKIYFEYKEPLPLCSDCA